MALGRGAQIAIGGGLAIAAVAMIANVVGGSGKGPPEHPPEQPIATPKAAAVEPVAAPAPADASAPIDAAIPADAPALLETTAMKLFADYTNEVAGDNKYRGKELRLTGRISRIAKDMISDEPYIALAAGNYGVNEVHAYFPDPTGLAERKRGQEVRLRCVGDGLMIVIPRLKACVLEAWR